MTPPCPFRSGADDGYAVPFANAELDIGKFYIEFIAIILARK